MIEKNRLYHKSAKGIEAIATRQHGLQPKLRSMLIMIDGKRTYADLEQVSKMLGDTQALLNQLLDDGFIEPGELAPVHHAPAPHSGPAPLAPATGPAAATLVEAQRRACRRLTDLLGPNAEELCLRIEGTRNAHDYQAAVVRAEGILRQYVSSSVAAEFMADVQAHMPSA
jgi:hypothetical protein